MSGEDMTEDFETGISIDDLLDAWREYLPVRVEHIELVLPEHRGILGEHILNEMIHYGPDKIYKEFPEIIDIFRERLFTVYTIAIGSFFDNMGMKGVDPRATLADNESMFWDAFVHHAEGVTVKNIWDIFNYRVVVVKTPTFPLELTQTTRGGLYHVVKNDGFNHFTDELSRIDKELPEKFGKLHLSFSHGHGFIAVPAPAREMVKDLVDGKSGVSSTVVYCGIHNWNTGEGYTKRVEVKTPYFIAFDSAFIDNPETGVMK